MLYQSDCFLIPLSNFVYQNQIDSNSLSTNTNQIFFSTASSINYFNPNSQLKTFISTNLMQISAHIKQNLQITNQIMDLIDSLEQNFESMEKDFNLTGFSPENLQKDLSALTSCQDSFPLDKPILLQTKNNRTHPKIKLMERIFGKKQYSYKLAYDGKFPKVLFKQRNISLKIFLKNMLGDNVINGSQLSLNLKIFKNNGEEIVSDRSQNSFMQGLCQAQIYNGIGMFSKIHPQQVSRGFSGKGICIIIYATSQQDQATRQGLSIQASQIQPLIFYNVKVVVKQNKMIKKNQKQNLLETNY